MCVMVPHRWAWCRQCLVVYLSCACLLSRISNRCGASMVDNSTLPVQVSAKSLFTILIKHSKVDNSTFPQITRNGYSLPIVHLYPELPCFVFDTQISWNVLNPKLSVSIRKPRHLYINTKKGRLVLYYDFIV